MRLEFDVIVIGGGGSGLAAAASAAECGAEVLLLEKQSRLGGTTGIAVGSFTAAGTRLQTHAGIDDEALAHAEDAAQFAPAEIEAQNNDSLRRYFLSQAAETLDWLLGMGLHFHGPNPEPPNRVPRMHNVVPGGQAYVAALQAKVLRHGGTVQTNAAVQELLHENGSVVGVAALVDGEPIRFHARRGVVLAAGDYANSADSTVGIQILRDRFTAKALSGL